MLIRYYWPNCRYRNKSYHDEPMDSFWVEATGIEAEKYIFPYLLREDIAQSRKYAQAAKPIGHRDKPGDTFYGYCYLVSRDLSSIEPLYEYHPFSSQHYLDPYQRIRELHIKSLQEIPNLLLD